MTSRGKKQRNATLDKAEETAAAKLELTPSWFSGGNPAEAAEDLAQRYRRARADNPDVMLSGPEAYEAYRRRLEERFQTAKRMANDLGGEIMSNMEHAQPPLRHGQHSEDEGSKRFQDWQRKLDARNGRSERRSSTGRLTVGRVVGLFAGACALGGLAGFGSANFDVISPAVGKGQVLLSSGAGWIAGKIPAWTSAEGQAAPDQRTAGVAARNTVLTKKPIKMARVAVADAAGVLNEPIPLELEAIPSDPKLPLALKITGLPEDAYLTHGRKLTDGEWLLKSAEIDGVKLVVPKAEQPQLDLSVAGVEENSGTAATPPQEMTVALDLGSIKVLPANAPPELQSPTNQLLPSAIPLPMEAQNPEADGLYDKAEALLKTGDIVSARQFFVKAHSLGSAKAAFGAGQTYDPAVYAAMNVLGLKPDRAKALEWYNKAVLAGSAEAQAALEILNVSNEP